MAWVIDAYPRNELEIGEHHLCPHCKKNGEAQLNACEKHKWASKRWFEGTFNNRLVKADTSG